MIHITLSHRRVVNPESDPLARSEVGYYPGMSDQELYQAGRAAWVLGSRANQERYAVVTYGGIVRLAIAITGIVPAGTRRAIEGKILGPGDEVYDTYVGKPSPVPAARNPITYFDAPIGHRLCRCGCGEPVTQGLFLPGHDQKAIHERIAKIGTVADFLDWFDSNYEGTKISE